MFMDRRSFTKALVAGAGSAALHPLAAAPRKLQIGHTALTWNAVPRSPENLGEAVKDVAELGYHSWETFATILGDWEAKGTLAGLIQKHGVPLKSGYYSANLIDPAGRKEAVAQVAGLAKILKKHGGTYMVLASNGVQRNGYNFKEHLPNIVATLNDFAKAINDAGIQTGFHQHTGTAIDSEAEVYGLMHAADTRHLTFAPDVGQLQKGGSDPVKVLKDFRQILTHMHFKDFVGGPAGEGFSGYCPIGKGKVDLKAILDLAEGAGHPVNVMVELDRNANNPMSARETAAIAKAWLKGEGYSFRS
jgi:inosose dehydratase